jgi:hypothetical protein
MEARAIGSFPFGLVSYVGNTDVSSVDDRVSSTYVRHVRRRLVAAGGGWCCARWTVRHPADILSPHWSAFAAWFRPDNANAERPDPKDSCQCR